MFRDNKLRALATTAHNRLASLPDVPTLAEKGITANGLNLIMGLYAPHGLPDGVQRTLTDAVQKAAKDPTVVDKIEGIGLFALMRIRLLPAGGSKRNIETSLI